MARGMLIGSKVSSKGGRSPRSLVRGSRRRASLAVGTIAGIALLVGCSGGISLPGGGGGGGGGGGAAFTGDACALLQDSEIQQVMGQKVLSHEKSTKGCDWTTESNFGAGVTQEISLEITSPGGREDFTSTKQFLSGGLGGALNSLVAPADSAGASIGLNPGLGGDTTTIPGIGDDAFRGIGNVLYAVKGDTEISLQVIAVTDDKATEYPAALGKIVMSRIP